MEKKIKVESHGSLGGIVWIIGWLFSIGFLKLNFWKGFLALIVWPYFLGAHFAEKPPSIEAGMEEAGSRAAHFETNALLRGNVADIRKH